MDWDRSKYLAVILLACTGCGIIPTLDEIIMRPSSEIESTPADLGYAFQEITLPITESRSINIWQVYAENPKGIVLMLPGSDENKGHYVDSLPIFVTKGYDVVIPDYEGFGTSPGEPTMQHAADDAFALVNHAFSKNDRVILFAFSLGTPLAVRLAAEYDLAGVILEATLILEDQAELWLTDREIPFGLFRDMANLYIYPQTPQEYDVLQYISRVDEPKLFLHSPEDERTPYTGGRQIFDVAPPPKEFRDIRGRHGQMIKLEPDLYQQIIRDWLEALDR